MRKTATSEATPVKKLLPHPLSEAPTPLVIRPRQQVLARKIAGFVLLLVVFGALPTLLSQFTRPDANPGHYLPGFTFLSGILAVYLLFLGRALFLSLNRRAEIRVRETGVDISLDNGVRRLDWADIRSIRFGDIHLFVLTDDETIEIPFIAAADQRLLFRLHYRHTGLTPDEGRFLRPLH